MANSAALEPPLYGLDIETDTTVDGLDAACSAVVAVAVTGADRPGDRVITGPEPELLAALDAHLATLAPGVLVTWNGAGFDLPFLAHRAQLADVPLGLETSPLDEPGPQRTRREDPPPTGNPTDGGAEGPPTGEQRLRLQPVQARWGEHLHLDGYRLYRGDVGRRLGFSCALKSLSRQVGLRPVEVARDRIHLLSDDELHAYVSSDARLARELVVRRLPAAWRWVDHLDPSGVAAPGARSS